MSTQQGEIWLPSTVEREATIQFSDTYSDGHTAPGAPPITDFDSPLTSQVRNEGFWTDGKFPIGAWPDTGNYAAVLLTELRQEQRRIYEVYESFDRTNLPDAQVLERSLGKVLVGVINWAPRREDHHIAGKNGDDFYVAELEGNIQVFSQLLFLKAVASRGLVRALWRIRDDNPIWPKGEQFRSSIVTQLRNFPEALEAEPLSILPTDENNFLLLAFADKYGNGRLARPSEVEIPRIVRGNKLCLKVDGKQLIVIGATTLPEIPEDQLGVYLNPADINNQGGQYLELARRVSDPNDTRNCAYETLRRIVLPNSAQHPDWAQVEIELAA